MNCFDDIPEDDCECYPCPKCNIGNIKFLKKGFSKEGIWECDTCDFIPSPPKMLKEPEIREIPDYSEEMP